LIIVARHGQTDWNVEGRYQGTVDVPLNATGWQQAESLADELAHIAFDVIVTSDLQRTQQTASVIANRREITPVVEPGLREIYVGDWQGLLRSEVAERFPAEVEQVKAGVDLPRGGGETFAEAGLRGADALKRISTQYSNSQVLVVAHGIVLQHAMKRLIDEGVLAFDGNEVPHLSNAGWLKLEL
jgi:glucosyl-3-phosphoglycerate phosphatase